MVRDDNIFGLPWRDQVVMRGWIVDFHCSAVNLIVEVDGSSHTGKEAQDARRDLILTALGFTVIRFTNDQVLKTPHVVLRKIQGTISDLIWKNGEPSLLCKQVWARRKAKKDKAAAKKAAKANQ